MKEDGGSAYPGWYNEKGPGTPIFHTGMSIRDAFAIAALQGFIASGKTFDPHTNHDLVARSYQLADAALKERSK